MKCLAWLVCMFVSVQGFAQATAPATQPSSKAPIRNGVAAWKILVPEKYQPKGKAEWADKDKAGAIATEKIADCEGGFKAKILTIKSDVRPGDSWIEITSVYERVSESRHTAFVVSERITGNASASEVSESLDKLEAMKAKGLAYTFAKPIKQVTFETETTTRQVKRRTMNPDAGISVETESVDTRYFVLHIECSRDMREFIGVMK